jgi:hypothetical protein
MSKEYRFSGKITDYFTYHKEVRLREIEKLLLRKLFLLLMVFGFLMGFFSPAFGQEVEPNNTCQTAQDLETPTLPLSLNGSLDSTQETPDVDFFKVTVTPNNVVSVNLEGAATGKGTLDDLIIP